MTSYQHAEGARRSRRQPSGRRPIWRWVGLGLAVALLVLVGLFAWDAYRLKDASAELKAEASAAKAAVTARDAEALQEQVELLQASATTFANATTGPHWWIANHLPWVQ